MGFVEFLTATPRPSPDARETALPPPWMVEEIRKARRRLTERQWRVTRLTVHREIYAKERAAVKACVQEAKRRFYCEIKIDSSSSYWQLLTVSGELLGKSSTAPLPSDIPRSDLPDQFCDFFSDKIYRYLVWWLCLI